MSRMAPVCSLCGVKLPPELQFSSEERAKILSEESAAKHELKLKEEALAKEEAKKAVRGLIAEATGYSILPFTDDK